MKALALAAALAVAPIPALAQPACVTIDAIKEELAAKHLNSTTYIGDVAQNIVASMIALLGEPPDFQYSKADTVIVTAYEGRVYVRLLLDGCYIGGAILTPAVWNEMLSNSTHGA